MGECECCNPDGRRCPGGRLRHGRVDRLFVVAHSRRFHTTVRFLTHIAVFSEPKPSPSTKHRGKWPGFSQSPRAPTAAVWAACAAPIMGNTTMHMQRRRMKTLTNPHTST